SPRPGVWRSPSRAAAAPSCPSSSRTSTSNGVRPPVTVAGGSGSTCSSWKLCRLDDFILSRPMVVHVVAIRLPQADPFESGRPQRRLEHPPRDHRDVLGRRIEIGEPGQDRKSTRLNSSHQIISYAVFCLK